jgi:hypothetical protein
MLIETLLKVTQTATNNAKKKQQEVYFATKEDRLNVTGNLANACESAEKIVEAVKRIVSLENVLAEEKIAKLKALLNPCT